MRKSYLLSLYILSFLFCWFSGTFTVYPQTSLSSDQVLAKTAEAISPQKGIKADFTISGNGSSGKGSLKSAGGKFNIALPDMQVWYNGKELYTYNKSTSETTLVNPTSEELYETNPLLYINGYKGKFTSQFANEKQKGKYVVELYPKSKGNDIKKLIFIIKAADFNPEKITVVLNNGSTVNFQISSISKGLLPSSDFEYPKSIFPSAEIIDLR